MLKTNFRVLKINFRVPETNFKVLKTKFRVLKIDFRVLEPNFKVPKLEKAKILSVLFVSQVIVIQFRNLAFTYNTRRDTQCAKSPMATDLAKAHQQRRRRSADEASDGDVRRVHVVAEPHAQVREEGGQHLERLLAQRLQG